LTTSGYKEMYALHHPPLLYLIVQRATSHRYTDLAQRHHTQRLRLCCFSSWLHLVRTSQGRRKVEVEAAHHQEKMAALLQAAALGRLTTGTSVSDQRYIVLKFSPALPHLKVHMELVCVFQSTYYIVLSMIPSPPPQPHTHTLTCSAPAGAGDDGRKDVPEKVPVTKHAEVAGDHRGRREPTTASGTPEPIIWQTARQQLVSNW